jgi:carboxypeptidase Taq
MTTDSQKLYEQAVSHYGECAILHSINAVLEWDEQTKAPVKAGAFRADQIEWVARMLHRKRTDERLGDWLESLAQSDLAADPQSDTGATIRVWQRDFLREQKRPERLVAELSKQTTLGQQAWVQARKENDFSAFAPYLETIMRLKREEADALGFESERYDALLEDFEPGATTEHVASVLDGLKQHLVPLIQRLADAPNRPDSSIVSRQLSTEMQRQLGMRAAAQIGFDFDRGRLDVSAHPFSTELGPDDCRITTRYDESFFPTSFFGTLHEAGHGMYEQGLNRKAYGLPLGTYASLGIHESQSRLWENFVGRSYAFWQYFYPTFQQHHSALSDVTLDDFYFAMNDVKPSLIRVEADEATYNLHIIIRFELERRLLDETLAISDLPEAWHAAYEGLLGIRSLTDADGVMQDVHWGAGLIGYFPTYSLGNLFAAQLFAAASTALGDLDEMFRRGQFGPLLGWMRENVHSHGRRLGAVELVELATNEAPNHQYLVDHLQKKLEPLYFGN